VPFVYSYLAFRREVGAGKNQAPAS
jgi:hypothetical protein